MTSLTNFAVFLIGSTTSLPALRYFCIYLAASLAFLLLLQSTILVASLALDLRRSQASRVDVVQRAIALCAMFARPLDVARAVAP